VTRRSWGQELDELAWQVGHPERFYTHARTYADSRVCIIVDEGVYRGPHHQPLYQSQLDSWLRLQPILHRAERVCERLNRSTLTVAAAELKRGGLKRLFNKLWKEDERDWS
jgi:hypothetical protein